MNQNLQRYDLSDWLIHFTRPLDTEHDDSPPELSVLDSPGECVEESVLSPFFLLRRILRKRQILSTWSIRGGRPTVYGPHPAVCFTEMPLAAFIDTSGARSARGENVSSYAVLMRKAQAFQVGARPVIYGLSNLSAYAQMQADGTRRFPDNVLAQVEQYRYVAFNPTTVGQLDWSHEREWRWPNPRYKPFMSYDIPNEDTLEYTQWNQWNKAREWDRCDDDGLCLDSGSFNGIGFLVKNDRQVKLLTHDILRLVDAKTVPSELFTFILRLDALSSRDNLLEPDDVAQAIEAATVPLKPFFDMDVGIASGIRARFDKIVKTVCHDPRRDAGELGCCWLRLADNTHPLTRALILVSDEERQVVVSHFGHYLVCLPELGDDRGLHLRQNLTRCIADRIYTEFGTQGSYYAVLNSGDPDGIPSYTDYCFDNIYVNEAHDKNDF